MLANALRNWQNWGLAGKPELIRIFATGQNHHTGLIAVGVERYVLKVFTHSFEHAIAAEQLVDKLEISPRLLFAADNIALFDYIQSETSPEVTLRDLAYTLSKIHETDASTLGEFNLLGFCDDYLSSADKVTHSWHQALLPTLASFVHDPTPWCFCHNDLVQENCLVADKLYLIDWEFAQQNNPWFDLAAIIIYFRLNQQSASEFLGLYKSGWQEKTQQAIFYTSQVALLWCDLLWNMHKFGNAYRANNPQRFQQLKQLAAKLDINLAT